MIIGRNKKKALQESLHDANFLQGFFLYPEPLF